MSYNLFLFDLDDTLLDFRASEKLSFYRTMEKLDVPQAEHDKLFEVYQVENKALWKLFEESKTTKDHLKVERFRKTFLAHKLSHDANLASQHYLDTLPQTVVLIDQAVEICEYLSTFGEIGIITNGIHHVQTERIKNSKIAGFIKFVSVSETAGYAKPDVRFFEHSSKMAKTFEKARTLVIGDRVEADVLGAHNFGLDCCWFNPYNVERPEHIPAPKYEIKHLSELKKIVVDQTRT